MGRMRKADTSKRPTAKKQAPVAAAPVAEGEVFGVSDIAQIIKVQFGKDVKTRDLRTLLRKMARDGRLNREIIAGNRERWTWGGPDDPEVEQILEAYGAGELEQDKKEKLDALKARKAEQKAAKKAEEDAAAEVVEEDGDEELVEDEED